MFHLWLGHKIQHSIRKYMLILPQQFHELLVLFWCSFLLPLAQVNFLQNLFSSQPEKTSLNPAFGHWQKKLFFQKKKTKKNFKKQKKKKKKKIEKKKTKQKKKTF